MNNDRQKTLSHHLDAQVCVFSSQERTDTFAGLSAHFSVEFVTDVGTGVGTATSGTDICTQSIAEYLDAHKDIELCIIDDAALTDTDKQVAELLCWLESQSSGSGSCCAGTIDDGAVVTLSTNKHLRIIFYANDTRCATDALFARLTVAGIYDIVVPALLPKGFTAQSTLMLYALKPQTKSSAARFIVAATTSETGNIDKPANTKDRADAIGSTADVIADAIVAVPDTATNLADTASSVQEVITNDADTTTQKTPTQSIAHNAAPKTSTEKQNAPAKEAILEPVRKSSEEVMLKPSQVAQVQVPTVQQDIQTEAAQLHTLTQQGVPTYPQMQYHIPVQPALVSQATADEARRKWALRLFSFRSTVSFILMMLVVSIVITIAVNLFTHPDMSIKDWLKEMGWIG